MTASAHAHAADAKVVFTPSGQRGTVPVGTTVLDAARHLGVDLDSVCNGRALCGRCMVVPAFGDFAKHAIVSEPRSLDGKTADERAYRGRRTLDGDSRLGCSARILADVVVDVPAASQVHRPVVRKTVALDDLVVDPVVRLYLVDVPAPDLGADRSDLRRLLDALAEQWALTDLEARPAVLAELQPALARGARTVTVAVHASHWISAVWPGFVDTAYGVAIDVGSTTVAGHLCDVATGEVVASAGIMNPQIRFGEDLMSRVSYVMMHEQGAHDLKSTIRGGLRDVVDQLASSARVERDRIVDVVLVGNPIMHHLVLGIDPTPLGTAPFTLATDEPIDAWADDVELALPNARLHVLPCIAGHVGADTAAAVLQEGPHRSDAIMLLVDVGTNAEIVLGNRDWLYAASSPTGPAFEGAQLSCGQRATAGAIERVRIDRDTLAPRVKVIGVEAWSDEPDFAQSAATIDVTGVCGSGVIEAIAELFLAGVILRDGTIDGAAAARSARVVPDDRTFAYVLHTGAAGELRITQNDVRAIQLAKAALNAGIRLLMDHAGITGFDSVRLAGAFGNHIDPAYALVLGLIPDCDPAIARNVGNAAGSGAVRALLSRAARQEIATVARKIVKIETAIEPSFQAHFVRAMGFPDSDDATPSRRTRRASQRGAS
ncbi:MAG: drug:proton antiporter [Actinomycetia bacterium]|nr:drug:proton antiporter [Actinomycetes bacterium]